MLFTSWLRNGRRAAPAVRRRIRTSPRQRASFRPRLEVLEDRVVPSGYQQINLVGYQPGMAHFTDPNLNGWGMTSMPDGSFVVANAFSTGLATFYDSSGHVLPQTITVPVSKAGSDFLGLDDQHGHPTGVVYNPTNAFTISENGKSAPARLIFDSIDGTISGWNPDVDPNNAILIRDTFANGPAPAVYTGLEIGQDGQGNPVLYATDFLKPGVADATAPQGGVVEMIGNGADGPFTTLKTLSDPTVANFSDGSYGAWSVQAVNGNLFVTFASLKDLGGGVVDVFSEDGTLLTPNGNYFASNYAGTGQGAGPLQNPWGITQAPSNFGAYSNDLLVGNVAGTGNINVYNPKTGAYLGELRQPNGTPVAIKGLWDLEFGDGTPHGGKTNWLYFDAGPNHPNDATGGLFGVIKPAGNHERHEHGHGHGHGDGPARESMNNSVGMSSSPNSSGGQDQWIEALSLMAKSMTMVPPSDLQALDQRIDAVFPSLDAMLASLASRLETMDPQLSPFLSMDNADRDTLETTIANT